MGIISIITLSLVPALIYAIILFSVVPHDAIKPKIALQPLGWSYVDTRPDYNAPESENTHDWVNGITVDDDNGTDQSGTADACAFKFTAPANEGYRKNNRYFWQPKSEGEVGGVC